jgi:heme-degrading monooxygenase HmoA
MFRPRPQCVREFENAYGPDGQWAEFFRSVPEYLGTELLNSADGSGTYLTIDRWSSRQAFMAFRESRRTEYEAIDRAMESLIETEEYWGDFMTV